MVDIGNKKPFSPKLDWSFANFMVYHKTLPPIDFIDVLLTISCKMKTLIMKINLKEFCNFSHYFGNFRLLRC